MLCHPYKTLFVHIPKTAGQSIEAYFLQQLGPSPENRETLLLAKNRDPRKGPPQLSHLKAREYLSGGYISSEQFNQYFKFGFVRNPWDRLVSFYKYRGYAYKYDFKTFLFKHMPKPAWSNDYCHVTPQYDFLYHDGHCLVDFVGRFEYLQRDFETVCEALHLPPSPLPHLNKAINPYTVLSVLKGRPSKIVRNLKRIARRRRLAKNTFAHYSEYYDDEAREFVGELYRNDIESFHYSFERSNQKSGR